MHVLREIEKRGHQARHQAAGRRSATRIRADVVELEREIWELAGEEFVDRLAAAARRDPVREARPAAASAAARPASPPTPRVLQAIRDEHAIIPKIEQLPRAVQARPDLPRRAAELDRRRRPAAHDLRADDGRHRAPVEHQPEPPEHPDPHRDRPRDPRAASSPRPGNALLSVDYNQVELRVLAHIANEQVLRDIFLRGEDVHTETAERGLRPSPPSSSTWACASKAKMVNYGIVYGLPARSASPTACRSRRTRRRSSSTATWSASPPSRSS